MPSSAAMRTRTARIRRPAAASVADAVRAGRRQSGAQLRPSPFARRSRWSYRWRWTNAASTIGGQTTVPPQRPEFTSSPPSIQRGGQAPDVRLTPDADGKPERVEHGRQFPFGPCKRWVDYALEVPAAAQGNAKLEQRSDRSRRAHWRGKTRSSSGAQHSAEPGRVGSRASSSGPLRSATWPETYGQHQRRANPRHGGAHLREATSSSGSMSLEGTFTDATRIQTKQRLGEPQAAA